MRAASAIEVHKKTNRFAAPVLLVLGLGFLFVGHYFYEKTENFLQSADHAVGTVIELRTRDSTDGIDTYSAVVEYHHQRGENFKFVDSFSSSPPSYHTGQTVHVLYNRENPSEAQIDRGLANHWLTALFVSMGSLFLLMGLHSARRRFRSNLGRTSSRYTAKARTSTVLLSATGPLITPAFANCSWEKHTIPTDDKDRIVLFTDGIVEAGSVSEMYGLERLIEHVTKDLPRAACYSIRFCTAPATWSLRTETFSSRK